LKQASFLKGGGRRSLTEDLKRGNITQSSVSSADSSFGKGAFRQKSLYTKYLTEVLNMKKMIKILLFAVMLVLLLNIANIAACSAPEADQDIYPADIAAAVLEKLGIDPGDVGDLFFSEGDEDHIFDDMFLKIMFPPSRNPGGDIVYTMDLFEKYAIIQNENYKPVMFEIAVFKIPKPENKNDAAYRQNLSMVETMCKDRVASIRSQAHLYSPELAFAARNSNVYIFDNYIYYVIAEDFSAAYSTIRSRLTAKK